MFASVSKNQGWFRFRFAGQGFAGQDVAGQDFAGQGFAGQDEKKLNITYIYTNIVMQHKRIQNVFCTPGYLCKIDF